MCYRVFIGSNGRRVIELPDNKLQSFARFLYEYFNDCKLPDDWEVHHIDRDILNDNIDNLTAMHKGQHYLLRGVNNA